MRRGKPVENWKEIVDHISKSWQAKKGRPYPFMARDLRQLKLLCGLFTGAEVMALYDIYLKRSPYWGKLTGWNINGLLTERTILIDDPEFKSLVRDCEEKLLMKSPKQVAMEFGL